MSILITGGAGFIGSHTCLELLNEDYDIIVIDNLYNSCEESVTRVERITNKQIKFYKIDLLDKEALDKLFNYENIEAVIHFAGLKSVGESVKKPLEYYFNNITGTINLCAVMRDYGVKKLIFSSSATVYGNPKYIPITEDSPIGKISNPYGQTKAMIEQILTDLSNADSTWQIIILRYFNPIGAHESGLIGEDPKGIPNNLIPFITQVGIGRLKFLNIYGDDYDTNDGTGVRDYIHVVDLAKGHVKALQKMNSKGIDVYNLGTGNGYSVLQMVKAFEKVNNIKIPYVISARRPGDIAICYADASKAMKELGWKAEKSLDDMCKDAWRWQMMNPEGYVHN